MTILKDTTNAPLDLLDDEIEVITLQRTRDLELNDSYTHKQVFMVGEDYTVDENIYNLVLAVNKAGLITQFSCEGSAEMLDHHRILDNSNYMSHLVFGDLNHAFTFYEVTTEYLGAFWTSNDGATFSITALQAYDEESRKNGDIKFTKTGARGMVKFHPRDLTAITELWCRLAEFDTEE